METIIGVMKPHLDDSIDFHQILDTFIHKRPSHPKFGDVYGGFLYE